MYNFITTKLGQEYYSFFLFLQFLWDNFFSNV